MRLVEFKCDNNFYEIHCRNKYYEIKIFLFDIRFRIKIKIYIVELVLRKCERYYLFKLFPHDNNKTSYL